MAWSKFVVLRRYPHEVILQDKLGHKHRLRLSQYVDVALQLKAEPIGELDNEGVDHSGGVGSEDGTVHAGNESSLAGQDT